MTVTVGWTAGDIVSGWFSERIIDTGRLPLFCFFVAFLAAFGVIRLSVRMIRAEVSWWPGNVTQGGVHVHHVVFGVVGMVVGGVAGLAVPVSPVGWRAACAAVFGIGTALVLDEFALVLHLEDVYWSTAGRVSVDAVFVAGALTGLLLIGVAPVFVGDAAGFAQMPRTAAAYAALAFAFLVDFALAATTVLKGKIWTGLFGLFVPILLTVGAIRLARPSSPWARRFYGTRPRKAEKAERREERLRRPLVRAKDRLQDLVAGRPDHDGDHPGAPAAEEDPLSTR